MMLTNLFNRSLPQIHKQDAAAAAAQQQPPPPAAPQEAEAGEEEGGGHEDGDGVLCGPGCINRSLHVECTSATCRFAQEGRCRNQRIAKREVCWYLFVCVCLSSVEGVGWWCAYGWMGGRTQPCA